MIALGLMSGTSMDGIELALLDTDGDAVRERGPSHSVAYEPAFQKRIAAALETAKTIRARDERPGDLAELEQEITLRHAAAVRAFLPTLPPRWKHVELIGFHGQTVLHRPEHALTVQLGDGDLLAEKTGLPVVYDMRANDMALGGQGAPLVPAYHAALAHALHGSQAANWPKVFVNIGGISNVTFVPEHGDPVAFDAGPGNGLIDQWVQRRSDKTYDADGAVGAAGAVMPDVVSRYLAKPFFSRGGAKSLDRSDFTLAEAEGLSLPNGARTLAAVAAAAILHAAEHLPEAPRLWIICGGGRKNPHIMRDLREGAAKQGARVIAAEEVGLDGSATEAEAWAFLAVRAFRKMPLTFPTTTGCREAVSGGILAAA